MRYFAVLAASILLTACATTPDQSARSERYPKIQVLDGQRIAAVEANAINYSGKVIWVSPPTKRADRH